MLAGVAVLFTLAIFGSFLQIFSTDNLTTWMIGFFGILFAIGVVAQLIILFKTKRKIFRWVIPIISLVAVAVAEIVGIFIAGEGKWYVVGFDIGVYFVLLGCVAAVLLRKFDYAVKHRKRGSKAK